MTATSTQHPAPGLSLRWVNIIASEALQVAEDHNITVEVVESTAHHLGHVAITAAPGHGPALADALGLKLRNAVIADAARITETFDGQWGGVLMTITHLADDDGPVGEIPALPAGTVRTVIGALRAAGMPW